MPSGSVLHERGRWSLAHLYGQGKIRSVQHRYRGLRHMLRGSQRGECDWCRKDCVVAQRYIRICAARIWRRVGW